MAADPKKAKRGRPTLFTHELADRICELISQGVTLSDICRKTGMPDRNTVYLWMEKNEDFYGHFTRARVKGYDAIAEEAMKIANTPKLGITEEQSENGIKRTKSDMLGHRKLQVETRLKLLAKWYPQKYGDKIQQDITITDNTPMAQRMKAARERSKKS